MKRILLFIVLITMILQSSESQESDTSGFVNPKTLVRLHLIVPGILIEQNLRNNSTIIFDFASGFQYEYFNINGTSTSEWHFIPYFRIEPRIYTNYNKRTILNRRTDYYSGQYFGFQVRIGIPTNEYDAWQSFGPLWGFQRTLGNKGYWDISFGLGVTIDNNQTYFGGIGNFGIGFILN